MSKNIYHASPVQGLKRLDVYQSQSYPQFGPMIFASRSKRFAAAFGVPWNDNDLQLGTISKKEGKEAPRVQDIMGTTMELKRPMNLKKPFSIYKLEDTGFKDLRYKDDVEIYTNKPTNVIKEYRFNDFEKAAKRFNIKIGEYGQMYTKRGTLRKKYQ